MDMEGFNPEDEDFDESDDHADLGKLNQMVPFDLGFDNLRENDLLVLLKISIDLAKSSLSFRFLTIDKQLDVVENIFMRLDKMLNNIDEEL